MIKMLNGYYIVSTATSHRFKPFLLGKVDSICGNYRSIPQGWLHPVGALGTKDYSKPCHRCEALQARYLDAEKKKSESRVSQIDKKIEHYGH